VRLRGYWWSVWEGRSGATLDRLLYAYQALRGLVRGELLKIAEECEEIEVVKKRYRP